MVAKTIPPSKYAVFAAKGKMPDKLIGTWQYIWNSNLERTYTGDFDLYGERSQTVEPEVDVYVTTK